MKKYECSICGYVYDPKKGDVDGGIKAGTEFSDLPEDWTCPVCRIEKSAFTEIQDEQTENIAPQNNSKIEETTNNTDYDKTCHCDGCDSCDI